MYTGLVKLVLLDPSTTSFVFDILFPHFLKLYKVRYLIPTQLHSDLMIKLKVVLHLLFVNWFHLVSFAYHIFRFEMLLQTSLYW